MLFLGLLIVAFCSATATPAPRRVRISGKQLVVAASNSPIVLSGPNVVVKGPPYLPFTNSSAVCSDVVTDECQASGTCTSCTTFSEADIVNLRARGWNAIRLGVMWAGAQPQNEDALDGTFLTLLHAVLSLCDAYNITVILDNHGDMVGGQNCGNGVPAWFQQLAAPQLIGAPLSTPFPYNLVGLDIKTLAGWHYCGQNASMWREFSGDPNYNLKNACCQQMNAGGNPGQLGYTSLAQSTMDYLINPGPGRAYFVRYWRLLAEAVVSHPSAAFAELMNEPMTIWRGAAYDTWREAGQAILSVIPDIGISVMDTGEGVILPDWLVNITGAGGDISAETLAWIKKSGSVFYAWHWYGVPSTAEEAVRTVTDIGEKWGIPTISTEFLDCKAWDAAAAANISHLYWHYSAYCNTGPAFGNRSVPDATFGACILGWASGASNYSC